MAGVGPGVGLAGETHNGYAMVAVVGAAALSALNGGGRQQPVRMRRMMERVLTIRVVNCDHSIHLTSECRSH